MSSSVNAPATSKNQISRAQDSRASKTATPADESTRAGGGPRELPEVSARADALDAKWQSAIDAATD